MAPPFTLDWYVKDKIVYLDGDSITPYNFVSDRTDHDDVIYYAREIAKYLKELDYQGTRRGTVVYFTHIPLTTMQAIIENVGLSWETFTKSFYWRYVEEEKAPPGVKGRVRDED